MTDPADPVPIMQKLADQLHDLARSLLGRDQPTAIGQSLAEPLVSYSSKHEWIEAVRLWLPHADKLIATAPVRDCPACGDSTHRFLFHSFDRFPFHECRSCGTWFTPVVISREFINRFLALEPKAKSLLESSLLHRTDDQRMAGDKPRFHDYFTRFAPFTNQTKNPLYVDIGCGSGCSLLVAQEHGFTVLGIEEDEQLVEWGRQRSLPMQTSPDFPGNANLVSFWESLEHFPDPLNALTAVAGRMGSDGILALTVPNGNGLALKALRQDASWINGGWGTVFGHLNLFSHDGLRKILERAGLELLVLDSQYGSNLPELAAHILGYHHGASDLFHPPVKDPIRMPASLVGIPAFNLLGPATNELERSLNLAPILIAIACKAGTREKWAGAVSQYWKECSSHVAQSPKEQTNSDDTIHLLQREIDLRDRLLAEQQEALTAETARLIQLQDEITRRDGLLSDLQHRLNIQVDTGAARLAELAHQLRTGEERLGQSREIISDQALRLGQLQEQGDLRDRSHAIRLRQLQEEIDLRDRSHAVRLQQLQEEIDLRDRLLVETQQALTSETARLIQLQVEVSKRDTLLADLQSRLDAQVTTTIQVQEEVNRRDAMLLRLQATLDATIRQNPDRTP